MLMSPFELSSISPTRGTDGKYQHFYPSLALKFRAFLGCSALQPASCSSLQHSLPAQLLPTHNPRIKFFYVECEQVAEFECPDRTALSALTR